MSVQQLEFIVYIKDGCHLCESMLDELDEFKLQFKLERTVTVKVIDILENDNDFQLYHEIIPVLFYKREELCRYFFDPVPIKKIIAETNG